MRTDTMTAHELLATLSGITRNSSSFISDLREILIVLLTPVDGEYVWADFSQDNGRHRNYEEFTKVLADWSEFSIEDIEKLYSDDMTVINLLDTAMKRPSSLHAVDNVNSRPDGNSKEAGLRKLRADRPDLLEKVLAGEMKVHAAMLEAGFRKKMMQVPAEDLDAAIAAIERRYVVTLEVVHKKAPDF